MRKSTILLIGCVAAVALASPFKNPAFAQSEVSDSGIQYPVQELGGCTSKAACKTYCDDAAHAAACVDFAEKNALMDRGEAERTRHVLEVTNGPGGCSSAQECETYCDDMQHIAACLDYAEKNNLMSKDELREAKLASQAIARGVATPGNCKSKQTCDAYCATMAHIAECVRFGEVSGLISSEELAMIKKIMPLLERGETPGGCNSKASCDSYCGDPSNVTACAEFGVKAGLVTPEEAAMLRKTGGRGPGGCRGKTECQTFCDDERNWEVCLKFDEQYGLVTPDEAARQREEGTRVRREIGAMSADAQECIRNSIGNEKFQKITSGIITGLGIGEVMRTCFDAAMGKQSANKQEGTDVPF